jgi:Rad3-related DNA helicase
LITILSSTYKLRTNPNIHQAYSELLMLFSEAIPDGTVGFFPSSLFFPFLFHEWISLDLIKEN